MPQPHICSIPLPWHPLLLAPVGLTLGPSRARGGGVWRLATVPRLTSPRLPALAPLTYWGSPSIPSNAPTTSQTVIKHQPNRL